MLKDYGLKTCLFRRYLRGGLGPVKRRRRGSPARLYYLLDLDISVQGLGLRVQG